MDSFPYFTRPGTQGQITTMASYRGTKSNDEIYAEMAARLDGQPLTIPLVMKAFHEVLIDTCKQGWKVAPIENFVGYRFTSGGSFQDHDFQPGFDALNIKLSAYLDDAGDALAREDFSVEGLGHRGRLQPVIIRMTDISTNEVNQYTPDRNLFIELGNSTQSAIFDRSLGCKVQFQTSDGTLHDATDYGMPGRTRITARVPAGLTGPLTVVVTALIYGVLRSAPSSERIV